MLRSMRTLVIACIAAIGCALSSPARADITLDILIEMCSGNEQDTEARIRTAMQENPEMRAMSASALNELRARERKDALAACDMYLTGSLDQIVFFFDKDGLLENAKLICVPRSYYERPTSLRELLTYKLLNMTKKERASLKGRTAKFWVATTMLKLFGCETAPASPK